MIKCEVRRLGALITSNDLGSPDSLLALIPGGNKTGTAGIGEAVAVEVRAADQKRVGGKRGSRSGRRRRSSCRRVDGCCAFYRRRFAAAVQAEKQNQANCGRGFHQRSLRALSTTRSAALEARK